MIKRQKVRRTIIQCRVCGCDVATLARRPATICKRCRDKVDNAKYQSKVNYRVALAKYRNSEKFLAQYLKAHPKSKKKLEEKNG